VFIPCTGKFVEMNEAKTFAQIVLEKDRRKCISVTQISVILNEVFHSMLKAVQANSRLVPHT
jgi:hypothetical protein